jgi:hypothetical protein
MPSIHADALVEDVYTHCPPYHNQSHLRALFAVTDFFEAKQTFVGGWTPDAVVNSAGLFREHRRVWGVTGWKLRLTTFKST